jgi:hypothetical protein
MRVRKRTDVSIISTVAEPGDSRATLGCAFASVADLHIHLAYGPTEAFGDSGG